MTTKHIIVIGTEQDDNNPLAQVLFEIAKKKNVDIEIYITWKNGTYKYPKEEKNTIFTIDLLKRDFPSANLTKCNYKLLLIDAVSIGKDDIKPITGLLIWKQFFGISPAAKNFQYINLINIIDIFFKTDQGCWVKCLNRRQNQGDSGFDVEPLVITPENVQSSKSNEVFWTGLYPHPEKNKDFVSPLVAKRWGEIMQALTHQNQNR